MNEKLYEALDVCLKALETGADPQSVVKLFPEMKADLLPLLEISQQARMMAIPKVPEVVLHRGRTRLLQHAAGMRKAASKPQTQKARFTFPRLAVSLAIAFLFFLSGTGLVSASGGALPGDDLYPVKRTWEDVRLLLVLNPESRAELEDEFERERLHEIDELLAEGRHETIRFAGVVTEQNGNLWIVSTVPVQITADSRLPETAVKIGTSVTVQGRTNAQGFVEAERVEILGSDVVLPRSAPTEIESQEDISDHGNSGTETNDNGQQDEEDFESVSNENHGNSGSKDDDESNHGGSNNNDNNNGSEDDSESGNSGSNSNDNSNEDRSGKGGSGDNQNDSSGSGGGQDDNNNENKD